MNRIRRVLLSRVGYKSAWYDGVVLPFHDRTGATTDTIISLPNGEGKTTLLSLLMCTFDAPQRRFIQHLQKPNQHFRDYFGPQPGFIVIEMERPGNGADLFGSSANQRLVIGQMVTVRDPRADPDRHFFLFDPNAELDFDRLPLRGISDRNSIDSTAQWREWLSRAREANPTLWTTQNQRDWEQRLDEAGVDPWLVQRQVEFCSSEGGIDGFLNFRSESEFLARFYAMALEEQRAATVRETLRDSLIKLKSEPQLQDRVGALRELQAVFKPFVISALEREQAGTALTRARAVTAGLYQAITEHTGQLDQQRLDLDRQAQATELQLDQTRQQLAQQLTRHETLQDLWHRRRLAEADESLEAARQAIAEAETQAKSVAAAAALAEWRALQQQVSIDEQALIAADGDLSPLLEQARYQGSLLRARLLTLAQTRRNRAAQRSTENTGFEQRIEALVGEQEQLRQQQGEAEKTLALCKDGLDRCESARQALQQAGQLEPDEGCDAALQRWQATVTELEQTLAKAQQESQDLHQEHKTLEAERNQHQVTRATLQADLKGLGERVERGREQHQALALHPRLRRLLGAERVDPDAGELPGRIEERLQRLEVEKYEQQRRLDELDRDRDSIEASGLSSPDPDSRRVQEHIREQGLADAKLYSHYLAEVLPDAEQARELTLSDPARFGGVLVYSGEELQRVRDLARNLDGNQSGQALGLRHPVVVSLAATGHGGPEADRVVIPAASDSAYSYSAAKTLLSDLVQRRQGLAEVLEQTHTGIEDYRELKQQLQTYLDEFGRGRLSLLENEHQQDRERLRQLDGKIEQARKRLDAIEQRLSVLERETATLDQQRQDAEKAREALERFAQEHESKLPELSRDLQQAEEAISHCRDQLTALEQQQQTLQQQISDNQRQVWQEQNEAGQYQQRHDAVEHHLEGLLEDPARLSEQELQSGYQGACDNFDKLSREHGMDALRAGLEQKRRQERQLQERYHKALGELDPALAEALVGQDLEALAEDRQKRLAEAGNRREQWLGEHGERKGQYKAFQPKQIKKGRQDPQLEALEGGELDQQIRSTERQQTVLAEQRLRLEPALKAQREQTRLLREQVKLLSTRAQGVSAHVDPAIPPQHQELPQDEQQLDSLQRQVITTQTRAQEHLERVARAASGYYESVRKMVRDEPFQRIEPRLAIDLGDNSIDAACDAASGLAEQIEQRTRTVQFELDKLEENVGTVVDRLGNLAVEAIELLKRATTGTRVPQRVPHFGGQPILKMSARFHNIEGQQRHELLRSYLSRLVRENHLPENGGALAAELIGVLAGAMHAEGRLGLRLIKPTDIGVEYMAVSHKVGSGGESLTAALLLYLVMAQLRGRSRAGGYDPNSGFLILDNPLGTANKPALIRPQLELARHFGIQLIYTTGIQDYNALSQFSHLLRLRRVSSDPLSGRADVGVDEYAMVESLGFDIAVNEPPATATDGEQASE